jgi:soluble lytic murein transglycosylase-like protein
VSSLPALWILLALGATPAGHFDAEINAAVEDVHSVWPVPAALIRAVIRQESAFDPKAKSSAGAIGLMQLMPANAAKVGFTTADLWEPAKNVLAGTRLLAVLLKHYEGDIISALVAYNAHPMKLGAPVPRNGETPVYVVRVLAFYRHYSEAASGTGADRVAARR